MMVDLASLNHSEMNLFLNSFDTILSDCDGVLWGFTNPILGIKDSLNKLKELGKEIHFITDNCSCSREDLCKKIKRYYSYAQPEDILFPSILITSYLKKIGFNKEIFCLGFSAMERELVNAGFKLAPLPPSHIPDLKSCTNYFQDNTDVGAVILDFHINVNFACLQSAVTYLQRPDVLFLLGASVEYIPMTLDRRCPGNCYFKSIIEEFTDQKAIPFGKPSQNLKIFVAEAYKIKDPSRVLFIGDSLEHDMAFADECGYKKLLVFSGASSPEDVANCRDKKQIPDYSISNLGDVYKLITNVET